MLRLFTPGETTLWLEHCRDYVTVEFGEDSCSSIESWRQRTIANQVIRQPCGDFATDPPTILGMITCIPLPHSELHALKSHQRKDNALIPWKPEDGKAVLWVDIVISDAPGIATKCIAGMLEQLDKHPCKPWIDTVAMICTGPEGYLMAQTFGLQPVGIEYQAGWPFMERPVTPEELDRAGTMLFDTWNVAKARDAIGRGRELWGPHWKDHTLG